jgi:hypothetical protein
LRPLGSIKAPSVGVCLGYDTRRATSVVTSREG